MSGRHAVGFGIALALSCAGTAQEPAPKPPAPPVESPELPAAERARADRVLAALAERCRDARVLVADYVQRRTTPLSKEPLVSSGAFLFVAEPAAVVFRAAAPRPSVVRLTETRYEVYRPQRKRLERFELDGPELARGLFAALGGDVAALRRDFVLAGSAPAGGDPAAVCVRFVPRREQVRERIQELALTIVEADGTLRSLAYRDAGGDLVEIALAKLVQNPERPPSADLDVPPDTQVLEHAQPRKAREGG